MSAVALLSKKPKPTDADIDDAMSATFAAAARISAFAKPFTAPHPCRSARPSPPPDPFELFRPQKNSEVLHGDSFRCKPS